jgi:hypothetical protein
MTSSKSPSPPTEAPAATAAPAASSPDVALVHRVTPDGTVHVIRRRGDQLEAGSLQPLREGAPIQGEVLSLRPRENFPMLCDVDVLYTPPAVAKPAAPSAPRQALRKGPAQVATNEYRDNWDFIWSGKKNDALN